MSSQNGYWFATNQYSCRGMRGKFSCASSKHPSRMNRSRRKLCYNSEYLPKLASVFSKHISSTALTVSMSWWWGKCAETDPQGPDNIHIHKYTAKQSHTLDPINQIGALSAQLCRLSYCADSYGRMSINPENERGTAIPAVCSDGWSGINIYIILPALQYSLKCSFVCSVCITENKS